MELTNGLQKPQRNRHIIRKFKDYSHLRFYEQVQQLLSVECFENFLSFVRKRTKKQIKHSDLIQAHCFLNIKTDPTVWLFVSLVELTNGLQKTQRYTHIIRKFKDDSHLRFYEQVQQLVSVECFENFLSFVRKRKKKHQAQRLDSGTFLS